MVYTSVSTGMSDHRLNSQLLSLSARNQTQTWEIIKQNTPQSQMFLEICNNDWHVTMLQNCRKYNYF